MENASRLITLPLEILQAILLYVLDNLAKRSAPGMTKVDVLVLPTKSLLPLSRPPINREEALNVAALRRLLREGVLATNRQLRDLCLEIFFHGNEATIFWDFDSYFLWNQGVITSSPPPMIVPLDPDKVRTRMHSRAFLPRLGLCYWRRLDIRLLVPWLAPNPPLSCIAHLLSQTGALSRLYIDVRFLKQESPTSERALSAMKDHWIKLFKALEGLETLHISFTVDSSITRHNASNARHRREGLLSHFALEDGLYAYEDPHPTYHDSCCPPENHGLHQFRVKVAEAYRYILMRRTSIRYQAMESIISQWVSAPLSA
jgi:hypothetical protein